MPTSKTILLTGISCVQFDDTRIASGSYDKTIRVWDIKSDESDVVLTLAGHSGTVRCLNLNGNRLVSGSVDRSIKVRFRGSSLWALFETHLNQFTL